MSDPPDALDPRRRRLLFRARHRGTKEADLMVGGFVARHVASFTEAELDALEAVLEFPDVDLADWLSGRRPVPAECESPLLARMVAECGAPGSGIPEGARQTDAGIPEGARQTGAGSPEGAPPTGTGIPEGDRQA